MIIKSIAYWIKRQYIEINNGGYSTLQNKVINRLFITIPILYGIFQIYSFARYILIKSIQSNAYVNLQSFDRKFSIFIKDISIKQSSLKNNLIIKCRKIEADKKFFEFDKLIYLYNEIIKIDKLDPIVYLKQSDAYYWLGNYKEVIANRLISNQLFIEQSVRAGLDLFGIRVIGERLWGFNIGHIGVLDILIKLEKLNLLSYEKRIVFVRIKSVHNICYLNYWAKYIDIVYIDDDKYDSFEELILPISEDMIAIKLRTGFMNLYSAFNLTSHKWLSEHRKPLLEISNFDLDRGLELLQSWSVPENAWFVCLHVREGDTTVRSAGPDSDVLSYIDAIESITTRGGWVIRMGHKGMLKLPPLPNVVDYANSEFKSDWMDVFLWANCRFFIGTSSGPFWIPPTFGRPVLLTNATNIGINAYFLNSLMIPKLFWSKSKGRLLTFKEMLDSPVGWGVSKIYSDLDGYLVDNTKEEINLAVIEMLNLLDVATDKDCINLSNFQNSFNNIRRQYGDTGQMTIAESFIKKYSELI
jgi:putative glycosyltransferase (TIGR04372 family)